MSLFSEFSLTAALPTSLPLIPSLSSVRRVRVVRGGGSSSPFAPVHVCRHRDLLDRRGGEEVSLDSEYEAKRLVGWDYKVIMLDLQ